MSWIFLLIKFSLEFFLLEFIGKMCCLFTTDNGSSKTDEQWFFFSSSHLTISFLRFYVQRVNRFMLNVFAVWLVKKVLMVFHLLSMPICKFIVSIVFIKNLLLGVMLVIVQSFLIQVKKKTVRIVALDRSYHVECYRCENCQNQFTSDDGCYPLDDHIFCLQCHRLYSRQILGHP